LGICRQTASLWYTAWQKDGGEGLIQNRRGPKRRLTPEQVQQLAQALVAGPHAQGDATDLWTLERIAALIEKLFGISYHRGHVWYLLEEMGFSAQKPQSRAIERNEEAITLWKDEVWPLIKRGHNSGVPS
jgi:transposase